MKNITADFFKYAQFFALVLSCANLYALEMRCVAHRGIHDALPENTAEAVKLAYDSGATWVETDFHSTKSGLNVCIHCEKVLETLSGCKKKIADLCADDLAQIDLGKSGKYDRAYRIPLMEDILKLVPKDRVLQAEIKGYSPTYASDFARAVKAAGLAPKNIVVSSFDKKALADFKSKYPEFDTMWLVVTSKYDLKRLLAEAKLLKVKYIALGGGGFESLDAQYADGVRSAGYEFRAWGVNKRSTFLKAVELGATGFTTNHYFDMLKLGGEIDGVKVLP